MKVEITDPTRAKRWSVEASAGDVVDLDDYMASKALGENWGKAVAPKKVK